MISFANEKDIKDKLNKRIKKGRLTELINEIRVKNNIPPAIIILPDTI